MEWVHIIALGVFLFGYIGITLEHTLKINKSAWALALAGILWTLVALLTPSHPEILIQSIGYGIFEIIVFLLAAMSLVEILTHYRFFDVIKTKLLCFGLNDRSLFMAIMLITFFLSAIINNLTVVIVMIQIARKFFWDKNILITGVGIVITANVGGAFSPIGDVTTIMLWLADKFTAGQLLAEAILPSLGLMIVATALLVTQLEKQDTRIEASTPSCEPLTRGEKIVITTACFSFLLPVIAHMIGLTPVIGILFGVGVTWLVVDSLKSFSRVTTHLSASIEHLIQKVDMGSIQFFVGILLAVGALEVSGVLEFLASILFPADASVTWLISANGILGIASALFDNIPLTAMAMEMIPSTDPHLWILLALTVGTGGSLLVIGSASGIIAMGMLPQLSFGKYFRIGFVPAFVGYITAIGIWLIQFLLL